MPRNAWFEMSWTLKRKWFRVWEVRDYYTNLELRAEEGAQVTFGYVLMVVVSAFLATGGLLLNSPAIVIGSMCVAPFLGPSRAVCIGGLFRNRRIFLGGLFKQLFGLLIIGSGIAYAITALLMATVPGIDITPEILLRSMPTIKEVVLSIIVAISAGAGAALALTADPKVVDTPWGQVIDAVIGVEIAISLIPPAAVVGIGLAFGLPDISYKAFLLMLVNILGLDLFGSMLMLTLRGIRVKYLLLEKRIRQTAESVLVAVPNISVEGLTINVTLLGETLAAIRATIRSQPGKTTPGNLAQSIVTTVQEKTGCRSEVAVEILPTQTWSNL